MKTKVCSVCNKRKMIASFYRRKDRTLSYRSECKLCGRIRTKKWVRKNKERAREHNRKSQRRHKEARVLVVNEWKRNNPERVSPGKKRWRQRNLEKAREASRKWAHEHPERFREYARKRRAEKNAALGYMPYDPESVLFGEQDGLCFYCRANLKQLGWHMEHKIPLSRGGKHAWENVCLSCPPCNQSKYIKTDTEFMA